MILGHAAHMPPAALENRRHPRYVKQRARFRLRIRSVLRHYLLLVYATGGHRARGSTGSIA